MAPGRNALVAVKFRAGWKVGVPSTENAPSLSGCSAAGNGNE